MTTNHHPEDIAEAVQEAMDTGIELGRRGLLAEALEYFDQALALCRDRTDSSDRIRLLTGQAYGNKGAALGDMDRYAEAVKCYDAAMEQYGPLVESGQAVEAIRSWLIALMNKGWALLNLGRDNEGLECHETALAYLRDICTQPPDLFAADLARCLYNVGEGYIRTGRLQQALAQYEQALEIWQRLIAKGETQFEEDIAYAVSSQADVMARLGNNNEALRLCDTALAEFTRLAHATENPKLAAAASTTARLRTTVASRLGLE